MLVNARLESIERMAIVLPLGVKLVLYRHRLRKDSVHMRPPILAIGLFLVALTNPAYAQWEEEPEAATAESEQTVAEPVKAERYLAVAANPHASRAGAEILAAGGSAADAAIGMQMVLGLVEPQSSGIGGGGFLLYHDRQSGETVAYDGRETAPRNVDESLFLNEKGEPLGFRDAAFGGRAVGTPGAIAMLEMVHRDRGKLEWARLFEPAIRLAEEGFAMSPRLHALLARHAAMFREQNLGRDDLGEAGRYFFTEAMQPKPVGSILRNPAYAATLERIARDGAEAFYKGPIADAIVEAVRDNPFAAGKLSLNDLADYTPRRTEPVCGPYRTMRICSMGPPSSGATTMLAILGLLNGFDMGALAPEGVEAVHLFTEAARLAYADRAVYTADDAFFSVPVEGLIDPDYLTTRRRLVDRTQAMDSVSAGNPPREQGFDLAPHESREIPSTSHLVAVDEDGDVLSFTTTVQIAFGSFVMTNGFLLNNELTDFSFAPRRDGMPVANRVEPGKKPRSSMTPTIGFDSQGRVHFAVGSPGGSRIISYVAKTITGLVDHGMNIQAAISRPNRMARNDEVNLEKGTVLEGLAEELRAMGHTVEIAEMTSGLHGLTVQYGDNGEAAYYLGGADPRREGLAAGQ